MNININLEYNHPHCNTRRIQLNNGEIWQLNGECNRCGECCEHAMDNIPDWQGDNGKCKHLSYETVDGERLAKCAVMWMRPAFCVFYPYDPNEPLPPSCSYSWEKIK